MSDVTLADIPSSCAGLQAEARSFIKAVEPVIKATVELAHPGWTMNRWGSEGSPVSRPWVELKDAVGRYRLLHENDLPRHEGVPLANYVEAAHRARLLLSATAWLRLQVTEAAAS